MHAANQICFIITACWMHNWKRPAFTSFLWACVIFLCFQLRAGGSDREVLGSCVETSAGVGLVIRLEYYEPHVLYENFVCHQF